MQPSAMRILVIEDAPPKHDGWGQQCRQHGHEVLTCRSAQMGLRMYLDHSPDVVLIGENLRDNENHWLTRRIREHEGLQATAVILLSSSEHDDDVREGLTAGADDIMLQPMSIPLVQTRLHAAHELTHLRRSLRETQQALREAQSQLQQLSTRDELTGLGNRSGFDECLAQYMAQARRDQRALTLMLCDVDFFKRYNDRLGHQEGDLCLKHIGQMLHQVCRRPLDYAARYGGATFALILPGTLAEGALTFAMALQHMMDRDSLYHPDSAVARHVTLSGGFISTIPDNQTEPVDLIRQTQEALAQAKTRGRYRFVNLVTCMDTGELSTAPRLLASSHAA
jgi:diguanylate cyclase (GGDEF)-like protein